MSPGGHLVTTLAACAAGAAYSQSWPLVAGIAAGGFLIDVDHAVDYVLFDGQRDLRPGAFLRYYLNGHMRRTVLTLHSWELFAALGVTAWVTGWPWLVGWLVGGLLHLALDLIFNGRLTPRSIVLFYSFAYRAAHRFDAARLLGTDERSPVDFRFWRAFFGGTDTPTGVLDSATDHASPRRRG
jgi:hypothetical protein